MKNSIGNGVAKELISMAHGHELSGGVLPGGLGVTAGGDKVGKIRTTVLA